MKYLILGMVLLSGCASLKSEVFENVHEGDSTAHVVGVLGQPDTFEPSRRIEGGTAWYYRRRSEVCGLSIKDDAVKFITCVTDASYVNPWAKGTAIMLGSMGQSAQAGAQVNQTIHCDSTTYGNSTSTDCR